MSTVPSLSSDNPSASDWRGLQVKGAASGPAGGALRLTESFESPFATLLEAVGIGGETAAPKVRENTTTRPDEDEEEVPDDRKTGVDKKGKKKVQDAASEVAGMLVAAGGQLRQPLNELPPVEGASSSSDYPPVATDPSGGVLASLALSKNEVERFPIPNIPFDETLKTTDVPQQVEAPAISEQLKVMGTPEPLKTIVDAPPLVKAVPVLEVSETQTGGSIELPEGDGVSARVASPRESTTAASSKEAEMGEEGRKIVAEPFSAPQMAEVDEIARESADYKPSAEGDNQALFEQDDPASQKSDSREVLVQPLREGVAPPQPLPSALPVVQFAGSSSVGGVVATAANGSAGDLRGGRERGTMAAVGLGPVGAVNLARPQAGNGASSVLGVDELAVHLGGLEGGKGSGVRSSGADAGQEILREAPVDRTRLLRAMARIEKTLKGLAETREARTISLRLDPPSLGSIAVDVSFRDGELHARLAPESGQVAAMLREQSHELHAALRKIGLWVDQVRVSIDTGTTGAGTGGDGARHGSSQQGGDLRDFGDREAPGVPLEGPSNSIGGAWRYGRWIA